MNKEEIIFYFEVIDCILDSLLCAAEKENWKEVSILAKSAKKNCEKALEKLDIK
jgi:hypothetical protein